MKYIVKIFCDIANGVELGPRELNTLKYNKLKANGVTERKYESWDDLLVYVKSFEYMLSQGMKVTKNHFLSATMCNVKDTRRHALSFKNWGHSEEICTIPSYYLGYLVKDEVGRVIDMRKYEEELKKFDAVTRRNIENKKRREIFKIKWALTEAKRDKDRELREGKSYWAYYRHMKTHQERRLNDAPEIRQYVRGRRSPAMLPTAYDDIYFHREKNWKSRNRKARRQWGVNMETHIDVAPFDVRWESEHLQDYFKGELDIHDTVEFYQAM